MTTSQTTSFLSEIVEGGRIPLHRLIYFRERLKGKFYDLIVGEFLKKDPPLSQREIARRLGKRPEQINRWLGSPGNLTLDTASDLMLAICGAEPAIELAPLSEKIRRNYSEPEWIEPMPKPAKPHRADSNTTSSEPTVLEIAA